MIREVERLLIRGGVEALEAKAEAKLICCEVSGLKIEEILSGKEISKPVKCEILSVVQKRISSKAPIQHLLGFGYFMGDKYSVNKDVLIPRPETELVVRAAVDIVRKKLSIKGDRKISILDIGTGSGCIACEISKALHGVDLEIMGVDISTDALRTAIKNMEALGQERRVVFRKSDIFSGLRPVDKFDIIVSNPPYIPLSARETLEDEVKNFDPELALFAPDNDGILFYKRIIEGAKNHLKPADDGQKRYLIFEIGYTGGVLQSEKVLKIAQDNGFNLENIECDLSGIERMICFSS